MHLPRTHGAETVRSGQVKEERGVREREEQGAAPTCSYAAKKLTNSYSPLSILILTAADAAHLTAAAAWALASAGESAPHPYAGCVLADAQGRALAAGHTAAEGATPAEAAALAALPPGAPPAATAYLSLEPDGRGGAAHAAAVALARAGVARVVLGMLRPEAGARGGGMAALAAAGLAVSVVPPGSGGAASTPSSFPADAAIAAAVAAADGTPWPAGGLAAHLPEGLNPAGPATAAALASAAAACLSANAPLLVRSLTGRPLGLLKYAMTLDGKIAASTGHAAWVSSPAARGRVFAGRAVSNAVVVGGNTVRRDDPRLTARTPGGGTAGHAPLRVVMSRTLDLPPDAALWETAGVAPTVVATQAGARPEVQASLAARGVEVVEFDFLTPGAVADYLAARGALQVLWECGGRLAAPAIVGGAIHRVMAFVAPKIIGGDARAPTPVGDLGTVSMGQALNLQAASWETVGPDVLCTGWLPGAAGGGVGGMDAASARGEGVRAGAAGSSLAGGARLAGGGLAPLLPGVTSSLARRSCTPGADPGPPERKGGRVAAGASPSTASWTTPPPRPVQFFKSWGPAGDLSNFSAHPVTLSADPVRASGGADGGGGGGPPPPASSPAVEWPTVEHFYQAQKFAGVAGPAASALVAAIAAAPSPEAAAKLGRTAQRDAPELVRGDWEDAKPVVMSCALRAKVATHPSVLGALTATGGAPIVEASPSDYYWGAGVDGQGCNALGRAWEGVRGEVMDGRLAVGGGGGASPARPGGVSGRAAVAMGGGVEAGTARPGRV